MKRASRNFRAPRRSWRGKKPFTFGKCRRGTSHHASAARHASIPQFQADCADFRRSRNLLSGAGHFACFVQISAESLFFSKITPALLKNTRKGAHDSLHEKLPAQNSFHPGSSRFVGTCSNISRLTPFPFPVSGRIR